MNKTISEVKERRQIFDSYRKYRRGVITLPYLERDLQSDLGELDYFIRSYYASKIQLGFIEIGILAIGTTADAVCDTLEGLNVLREYVATSEIMMKPSAHERYILANMRDDKARQLILNTLRLNGGLEKMLLTSHSFLEAKQIAYSSSLKEMKKRTPEAWELGFNILNTYYDGELNTLVGYWKKKLKAAQKIGEWYFNAVKRDLCIRYPDISEELGIDCPQAEVYFIPWPLILIAIACAILCEGD